MLYLPSPIGRICRVCGIWFPRHLLVKNKKQPDGVEKHCLACSRAKSKRWDNEHPGAMNAFRKKWERANPGETVKAIRRWQQTNKDRTHAANSRWAKAHPDKARAKVQKRRDRKRSLVATFHNSHWRDCLEYWHGVCAYCGNPPLLWDKSSVLTQEHFIPVAASGGYTPDNIVPACKSCNSSKCDSDPAKWLTQRFGKRKAKVILKKIQDYFDWVESRTR